MNKNLYMHTINGKPAMYVPRQQICFFNRYNRVKSSEVFVKSLSTIRRQQKASQEWRIKNGFGDTPGSYGYVRIEAES